MPDNRNFHTKAVNVSQLKIAYDGAALLPVDISALTPSSSFPKNAVLGINGVLYRAKRATADFPVTLSVDSGEFVTVEAGGKTAYVIADATLSEDWEVWTDAAIEYWQQLLATRTTALEQANAALEQRIAALEATLSPYTYNNKSYSVPDLLNALATLMPEVVVVQ